MVLLISRGESNRRLPDYRCVYSALCEIPLSAINDYWFGSFIPRERARKASQPDFPTKDRGLDTKVSQVDPRMKERGLGTKGSRVDL